jgi:hypothetical protein
LIARSSASRSVNPLVAGDPVPVIGAVVSGRGATPAEFGEAVSRAGATAGGDAARGERTGTALVCGGNARGGTTGTVLACGARELAVLCCAAGVWIWAVGFDTRSAGGDAG